MRVRLEANDGVRPHEVHGEGHGRWVRDGHRNLLSSSLSTARNLADVVDLVEIWAEAAVHAKDLAADEPRHGHHVEEVVEVLVELVRLRLSDSFCLAVKNL